MPEDHTENGAMFSKKTILIEFDIGDAISGTYIKMVYGTTFQTKFRYFRCNLLKLSVPRF